MLGHLVFGRYARTADEFTLVRHGSNWMKRVLLRLLGRPH
jgi:hypothetical protein